MGAQLPSTMADFGEIFRNERDCVDYLTALRWPNGFICPRCAHPRVWETADLLMMCSSCGHKTSLTAGTIFHGTQKPLLTWFRAIWYVTNQKSGVSALGLQRALGLGSYHTAWTWLHKLRKAMVDPDRDRLKGTVEVDEALYGGAKSGKPGRGAEGKELIFSAVEDIGGKPGRIRLIHITDASAESLEAAITQTIAPGATIRTDGWSGYLQISNKGYKHERLRSKSDETGEYLLPMADLVISLMKRWLLGTHQGGVKPSHLGYYLDEFTFRFNRRSSAERGLLFQRLVEGSIKANPTNNNQIEKTEYTNHGI